MRRFQYKDPFFMPKNTFKPKPREYYANKTTIKLTPEQQDKVKKLQSIPQPRFNKTNYVVYCSNDGSPEQRNLGNFAFSIAPPRRQQSYSHAVWLVKRPKGFKKSFPLNPKTKDKILPLIFEAIENGSL